MKPLKFLGQSPNASRLNQMQSLEYFVNGSFRNIDPTPDFPEEFSAWKAFREMAFPSIPDTSPKFIPHIQQDIQNIPDNSLVWFGHSSYLMKLNGLNILVDPVFSGSASPIPGSIKAFKGANEYKVSDLPFIDLLIISHDHYDHLDYKTIRELQGKVGQVVCGLGVGQHFEYWEYDASKIHELVWHQSITLQGIQITATPVRHFSGRGLKRNITLFCSYVVQTNTQKIFLGGDSGYGTHLKAIGDQYGPFDFGILECGQYNIMWKHIHTLPQEWVKVINDLQIKKVMPVHFGKFKLALHAWYEPVQEFVDRIKPTGIPYFTPQIGEILPWQQPSTTQEWWRK